MPRSGKMNFKFNDSTMDGILRAPAVVEATRAVAARGVTAVQAAAPVDTAAYRDGVRLERHEARYRTVWRVVGRDRKTMLIESRLGILARALKSLARRG